MNPQAFKTRNEANEYLKEHYFDWSQTGVAKVMAAGPFVALHMGLPVNRPFYINVEWKK